MSKRSNVARGGGRRWLAAVAGVLGVLMFSAGLSLVVQGGSNAANSTYPSNKVWVCKFVTDPKGPTKLKLGNHALIDVSITSLKGFNGTFPAWFNDKHGKSEALGWAGPGFPVPIADYVTNTCSLPTVVTPTPTPTPTPTSSASSSTPTPSSSASSLTPTPTPTSTSTSPSPQATSVTPTPSSSASVVIPKKVHSGLESLSPLGSGSPAEREWGLGLTGLGSVLMIGSMGLLRRTAKR